MPKTTKSAPDQPEITEPTKVAAPENQTEAGADIPKPARVTKAGAKSRKALTAAETEAARKAAAKSKTGVKSAPPRQPVDPLARRGKKYREAIKLVDRSQAYQLDEAIELAQKTASTKFDSSVELHINLGVDPKQADQMVRASVALPAGSGRKLRVAVVGNTAQQAEATKAGADLVGEDDLLAQIDKGKLDFDLLIATPDTMPKLAKAAKVLGPRGLMPNPKSGTVTADVTKAVKEAKAGKVEFRMDKQSIVHLAVGKVSFKPADLLENIKAVINAVLKAKPSATKGTYIQGMTITTSMGPGIKLDVSKAIATAHPKK